LLIQEISANAHETHDSISLISYAGCLGLSPVYISAKIHSKCASQPNGKMTISKGGTKGRSLCCSRSRGISSPSGTKLSHKKLETLGYHTVKTRSLYLTWPWIRTGSWQTDGQTDRIPI